MIKVFIHPNWYDTPDAAHGGIRRVWENQIKYLPEFSIELVRNPDEADVIANHGGDLLTRPGIPTVNHCHGLCWSRYNWTSGFEQINAMVIEAMRHAVAHTAPSEWVATSLRRGMLIYPEVIYHGINVEEWEHNEENGGYILWNKARQDFVSNPVDMNEVAKLLPHRKFVSTFGKPTDNVKIIGKVPYEEMKLIVKKASVYLATARETMGINTLEALGAGVPVGGFKWGGTNEIIIDGITGYLAAPGNYDELAECIEKCIAERERLSENAKQDAKENWRWLPKIKQYADLYKSVARYYNNPRPKVSVLVSAYNNDKYLPECLDSVAKQTQRDFECIIIDGAEQETTKNIVLDYASKDNRFKYRRTKGNLGLTGSRNFGLEQAKSLYIRHLDADDLLMPNALELESDALDKDWGIHIAYGHLENINEDGSRDLEDNGDVKRYGWPSDQFSWRAQMAHRNQLPSTVMVRRSVYERSGGYRARITRNEDAEFWCRVTSLGFRAKKITQAVTLQHRMRQDSKGAVEWREHGSEPDWTAWFPWRMGSRSSGKEGLDIIKKLGKNVPNYNLVPFGAQGKPPPDKKCWAAHDHSYPVVSVIVTVGLGHEQYLPDALDSVMSQTYIDWECIVVNDTGKEWNNRRSYGDHPLVGFPWAKYISTGGNKGTAVARNLGATIAKGGAFSWLDADDYWFPWFLEKMVASIEQNKGIIYSDIMSLENGVLTPQPFPEFDCALLAERGCYPGSSVLVPRHVHETIVQKQQGWDAQIPGWEDWDYQVAAAVYTGVCAYRVEEPLFVYRRDTSINRKKHHNLRGQIISYMDEKWREYRKGTKKIMCGCDKKKKATSPSSAGSSSGVAQANGGQATQNEQTVLLEYQGPQLAPFIIRGKVTNTKYKFSRQSSHLQKYVFIEDARYLLAMKMAGGVTEYVIVQPEGSPLPANVLDFLVAP